VVSETSLRGIQPAELDEFWPVAEPLLALGLKHGAGYRWTLPALRTAIAENRAYLWLTWPDLACAVITQIHDYPRAKVLDILWVCGRLPENWRGRVVYLEDWARGLGCTEVETGGRAGWARKLGECGYTPVPWITLRKPL
jgi:hypothetical protein